MEIKELRKIAEDEDLLTVIPKLKCISEGIHTFEYDFMGDDEYRLEINIMANNHHWHHQLSVSDILYSKDIQYLSVSIYRLDPVKLTHGHFTAKD